MTITANSDHFIVLSLKTGHEYATENLEFACHIQQENQAASVCHTLLY